MPFWDEFEGKSLAGTYPLNRWIRTEGRNAWFATRFQEKPAIAFVSELTGDDDPIVANLEAVSRINHPNVIRTERSGRAVLEGKSVAYAILEPTEENLADALRERPLTTEETTQITESLVGGLGALHAAGLLHSQVNAASLFAVGETVKLRSDCVQKVDAADKDNPAAYAQDVSDIGALIFESLTQKKLSSPGDPAIAKLPAPFAAIVQNTVAGRWGLSQVSSALTKTPVETPPPSAAKAAEAPIVNRAVPVPAKLETVAPVAATFSDEPVQKKTSGVRIIAIVALVLALGMIWYFYRAQSKTASLPESAAPAAGDTAATPAPVEAPPVQAAPAPEAAAPAAPPTQKLPAAGQQRALETNPPDAAAAAGDHNIWRVVVYTYGDEARAKERVDVIMAKHPDLKPEVFTAAGHGPYLVTVGGPMDHDGAFKLRSHARKEGMARDAYIQNYTH